MVDEAEQVQARLNQTLTQTRRLLADHSRLAAELRQALSAFPARSRREAAAREKKRLSDCRRRQAAPRRRRASLAERPLHFATPGLLVTLEESDLLERLRQLEPHDFAMVTKLVVGLTSTA